MKAMLAISISTSASASSRPESARSMRSTVAVTGIVSSAAMTCSCRSRWVGIVRRRRRAGRLAALDDLQPRRDRHPKHLRQHRRNHRARCEVAGAVAALLFDQLLHRAGDLLAPDQPPVRKRDAEGNHGFNEPGHNRAEIYFPR